jgi:Lar family restriction alleviation protein
MMAKTHDLKPCPFCGGEAWKTVWRNAELKTMYKISCLNEECNIQPFTDYVTDEETVVKDWNRRANDANA